MKRDDLIQNFISKLENFLIQKNFSIHKIYKNKLISEINDADINLIPNSNTFNVSPSLSVIIKKNDKFHLIIANIQRENLSLKNIGEFNIFCKVTQPRYAFLITYGSYSSEILPILSDCFILNKLQSYKTGQFVMMSIDIKNNAINKESILPFSSRGVLHDKLS